MYLERTPFVFLLLAALVQILAVNIAAATCYDLVADLGHTLSFTADLALLGLDVGRSTPYNDRNCSFDVIAHHPISLGPRNGEDTVILSQPDSTPCQAVTTMLLIPRAHPPRPSSAVISAHPDSRHSHLASILRSCSLWELVSLVSAVGWLFVCLAA
ncbi:hypothetical protein BD414DRAFT_494484 [Trametes punicea]|nr:hypothetical protein BD414DRAFT_494484 [Trametes punicea]